MSVTLTPGTEPGAGYTAADAGPANTPPASTAAPASTTPPLKPRRLAAPAPRETQVNIANPPLGGAAAPGMAASTHPPNHRLTWRPQLLTWRPQLRGRG